MMKHAAPKDLAGFLAMALAWLLVSGAFLLVSVPAHARKECRPVESEAAPEPTAAAQDRWPHDVQYGWHHETGDADWVHQGDHEASRTGAYEAGDGRWVHETDYGWWAAVPEAGIRDLEDEADAAHDENLEDCTISRERNECVVLANQLARYRFQQALAEQRDDALWEESLRDTIDRLEERGALHRCPWVEPSLEEKIRVTLRAVVEATVVAAQVAAKLYRMGLF
jgi:hypothetical protein